MTTEQILWIVGLTIGGYAALKLREWYLAAAPAVEEQPLEPLQPRNVAEVRGTPDPAATREAAKRLRLSTFEAFETLDSKLCELGIDSEPRRTFRDQVTTLIAHSVKV